MTDTQFQKLSRLRNYGTSYEVIAANGETRILICYAGRHSGHGLQDAIHSRAAEIVALAGTDDISMLPKSGRLPVYQVGAWRISFSGRTQREAICAGEHKYIGDIAAKETTQCS